MVRRYIHNEEIKMSQCMLPADVTFHQRNIQNTRKYEKVGGDCFYESLSRVDIIIYFKWELIRTSS